MEQVFGPEQNGAANGSQLTSSRPLGWAAALLDEAVPAMSKTEALATMEDCRRWWRTDVFQAFLRAV